MAINQALRAARLAANLGQADLAEAVNRAGARVGAELHCHARHIAKWEAGEIAWPQARYRRALESVFGVPSSALGFSVPAPTTSIRPAPSTASASLPPITSPARRGLTTYLNGVDGTLRELQNLERRLGSGHLLPLVDRQVRDLSERVRVVDDTALTRMAAWAHTLAGWMHHDSGDHDQARDLYKEGLFLAQMAADRSMVAYLSSAMSLQAADLGRAQEAVSFAQLGAAQFPRTGPVAALLAIREARGWAMASAERQARDAWRRARAAFSATGPAPEWAQFFSEGELSAAGALIARDLGAWDEAERFSRFAVADPYLPRRAEVSFRLVLIDVLLRRGDRSAAGDELRVTIPKLPAISSDRVRRRVRRVLRVLPTSPSYEEQRRALTAYA